MAAPKRIKELVEKFENNIKGYKSGTYNETNVRQEFIDPFFEELGWDVYNKKDVAPQYRDVIFEDSIKVGKKTKAPDYCFTLNGQKIFFVEAKKPSVDINKDIGPAFQVRRYAWSAKLPISVLTDFEELAIYESKTRPYPKDRASIGRVKFYKFTEYIEKWDEIANILSRDSVLKGNLDRFVEDNTKKGTSEVDSEFLKEIEKWRELLAKKIVSRNKEITLNELNFAVQQTIDRIIFLRMAEDKGIEPYGQLLKLLENDNVYEAFGNLCKKSDDKYNAGLFHFKEEKDISLAPDEFTLDLTIDNGTFKEIIKDLYYPRSPYEFSVISPEILGNTYEQFLGKVIRFTKSKQVKIEEKPEVKKAGGVFYTPQYIVDYIVENTLGNLLKNKTPNQVAKLKILDPACGSGSFLLGAYTYLLKWHLDYYTNQKKPPKETIYEGKNKQNYLTIRKKKEILTNNIFGVDIDSQAVEVTKLSLLLKVLEDENKDALEAQQKLFQERILPYLGDNIKCGNSLIGTDVLEDNNLTNDEIIDLNPFNWEDEFQEIFENGGFDIIIGNPPYGTRNVLSAYEKNYIRKIKKLPFSSGDSVEDFCKLSFLHLLKKDGILSFIIPKKSLYGESWNDFRENFLKKYDLLHILDTSKSFKGVLLEIISFGLKKTNPTNIKTKLSYVNNNLKIIQFKESNKNVFFKENNTIQIYSVLFENIHNKISNNSIFNLISGELGLAIGTNFYSESPEKYKLLKGVDIDKWTIKNIRYLKNEKLIKEDKKKMFLKPKIIAQRIIAHIENPYPHIKLTACYDEKGIIITNTLTSFNVDNRIEEKCLLSLINSKLFSFFAYNFIYSRAIRTMDFYTFYIQQLPFPKKLLDFPHEQKIFINYADKLAELSKNINKTKTPHEKKIIQQQIDDANNKIDSLIYELYGLTDEEIAIVEKSIV